MGRMPILFAEAVGRYQRSREKEEHAGQRAVGKAIPAAGADSLRILTWGVCMEGPMLEARIDAILTVIRKTLPNVVCLLK